MLLDWSDPAHWNNGHTEPCRWCGRGCWTLDSAGRVAHKACEEAQLEPTPDQEPSPPQFLDLAAIIDSLGGKCPVCGRFICGCEGTS